jgi:hypothetical protein
MGLIYTYSTNEKEALTLLWEAHVAAKRAMESTKIGNPELVRRATYEAVIASAPVNVRKSANTLRNKYGLKR